MCNVQMACLFADSVTSEVQPLDILWQNHNVVWCQPSWDLRKIQEGVDFGLVNISGWSMNSLQLVYVMPFISPTIFLRSKAYEFVQGPSWNIDLVCSLISRKFKLSKMMINLCIRVMCYCIHDSFIMINLSTAFVNFDCRAHFFWISPERPQRSAISTFSPWARVGKPHV